ncbi:MAG: DUF192 domain-containing protein [Polyangiaceae bacterium]
MRGRPNRLLGIALFAVAGCEPCDETRLQIRDASDNPVWDGCVEIASTAAERRQGLAGRPSLDEDAGMLLVFPITGEVCISAEGMRFGLDVAFIDGEGRVLAVSPLPIGSPAICVGATRCVLEIGAGTGNLQRGDRVVLESGDAVCTSD